MKIDKLTTKTGDSGMTSLLGGQRVRKDCLQVAVYGIIDELLAQTGMLCAALQQQSRADFSALVPELQTIQRACFDLGTLLAMSEQKRGEHDGKFLSARLAELERRIEQLTAPVPRLHSFVLPGSGLLSAQAHVARTTCRRAEREAVALSAEQAMPAEILQYLNRLSDYFFALARYMDHLEGRPEFLWQEAKPSDSP